jgi:anti-anti-sigma regulatory factor
MDIQKNEQFATIITKCEALNEMVSKEIETKVVGLYKEGYTNFVVDISNVTDISDEGAALIRKMDKLTKNEVGIFVLVTENDETIEILDDLKIDDLIILPSLEEAKEAIYMHELENEFKLEDNEEGEEYGEEGGSYSDYD